MESKILKMSLKEKSIASLVMSDDASVNSIASGPNSGKNDLNPKPSVYKI